MTTPYEYRGIILDSIWFVVAVIAIACGTEWLGWYSIPVIGFIYGFLTGARKLRGTTAAIAAVLAWSALLLLASDRGTAIGAVASQMGAVMGIPSLAFFAIALLFAAALAGPAAVLGCDLNRASRVNLAR